MEKVREVLKIGQMRAKKISCIYLRILFSSLNISLERFIEACDFAYVNVIEHLDARMSIIDGDIDNRIFVHLFHTGIQLKRILHTTILNSHSALLVGENIQIDDPSLLIGDLLGRDSRICQSNWEWLLDSTLDYLLIQFGDFVPLRSRLNLVDVRI
jgi:hypothetical protein